MRGVGNFVFWDCAGHSEYSITHGMFLGASQSIFVVAYDLMKLPLGIWVRNQNFIDLFFKNVDNKLEYERCGWGVLQNYKT